MNSLPRVEAEVLPWHQPSWSRLEQMVADDHMPHGLLIAGPPHSGKHRIVNTLMRRLLCPANDGPCGHCHQCQLVDAGTHPDLFVVTLEDSKQIVIDQIRRLIEWASQTSQQGGWKVCMIQPADRMNIQSSNALLKILEEPPARTCIVLVSDQPNRLLPTLRSRCQRVECQQPDRDVALTWLQRERPDVSDPALLLDIAGGVPLRAAEFITEDYLALRKRLASALGNMASASFSPIQLAATLNKVDPLDVLDILYQIMTDVIGFGLTAHAVCRNNDLTVEIVSIANHVNHEACFRFIDRINEAKTILGGTSNANVQMLFEWVLADDT